MDYTVICILVEYLSMDTMWFPQLCVVWAIQKPFMFVAIAAVINVVLDIVLVHF